MAISGIYKIHNIINNEFYIGSSKNLIQRKHNHFSTLRCNKHYNKHLQRAVNKYGIDNFKFDILKQCEISQIRKIEQLYIDELKPKYNKAKFVNENYSTNTINETVVKKLKDNWKNKLAWNHPQNKIDPDKVKNIINLFNNDIDISIISKKYNIGRYCILDILSGRKWKDFYHLVDKEKYNRFKNLKTIENIHIYDSNKNFIKKFDNLYDIRSEFNISSGQLNMMLRRQTLYDKKFFIIRERQVDKFLNKIDRSRKKIKLITSEEFIIFKSQRECAKHLNISFADMNRIINGSKQVTGYKIEKI